MIGAKFAQRGGYFPQSFWHLYLHLDLQKKYENAGNKADATSFLRNVARAAYAAELIARPLGGAVIEVHGSTVHVALPAPVGDPSIVKDFAVGLHLALGSVFSERAKVEGWRMSADYGRTLIVQGEGVHGDDSLVSLGNAANRPAKLMGKELAKSTEEERKLKRSYLAVRSGEQGRVEYLNLAALALHADEKSSQGKRWAKLVRSEGVQVSGVRSGPQMIHSQAAPISPPGQSDSPSADDPNISFGWVVRADLDGFTKRVSECFDQPAELQKLANGFASIMEEAKNFTAERDEYVVQLPWAGDCLNVAVVYADNAAYEKALATGLVEFSTDCDKALASLAQQSNFGGWAQGVAGGLVHGGAHGNIFVGSVEFGERRFLVGAGSGFGRSNQAFVDIDPKAGEIAVFDEDYHWLDKKYREKFHQGTKSDGSASSLFWVAKCSGLIDARYLHLTQPAKTKLTVGPKKTVTHSARPHSHG